MIAAFLSMLSCNEQTLWLQQCRPDPVVLEPTREEATIAGGEVYVAGEGCVEAGERLVMIATPDPEDGEAPSPFVVPWTCEETDQHYPSEDRSLDCHGWASLADETECGGTDLEIWAVPAETRAKPAEVVVAGRKVAWARTPLRLASRVHP